MKERKFARAEAIAAAKEVLSLVPMDRVVIAGSLRRRKEWVGDVEVVYIPRIETRMDPEDLLKERLATINLTDQGIEGLIGRGVLARRCNVNGATSWGAVNKLAAHCASGIPIDFFATTESAWWNYLVCRTGGAETNRRIATAALKKGWHWHPYGKGFTDANGRVVTARSEQEVFKLAGLSYLEPWERV